MAIAAITIMQTLLNLFAGGPSSSLQQAGKNLAVYMKQVVEYLSYASEHKPFPFSDWPESTENRDFNEQNQTNHKKT